MDAADAPSHASRGGRAVRGPEGGWGEPLRWALEAAGLPAEAAEWVPVAHPRLIASPGSGHHPNAAPRALPRASPLEPQRAASVAGGDSYTSPHGRHDHDRRGRARRRSRRAGGPRARGQPSLCSPAARTALANFADAAPDLVVLDVRLPGMDASGPSQLRRETRAPVAVPHRPNDEVARSWGWRWRRRQPVKPFSVRELVSRIGAAATRVRRVAGHETGGRCGARTWRSTSSAGA